MIKRQRQESCRKITYVESVKVHVGELRPGMYVTELDRPWLETPFLLQGFQLKTEDDVRAVQEVCEYVYIDVERTQYIDYLGDAGSRQGGRGRRFDRPPKKLARFEAEIETAGTVRKNTSSLLKTFIDEIRFGHSIDVQLAKSAVSDCVSSIVRNPDALMLTTQIRQRDEYTWQHSFNVCIYSIALGHRMGLEARDLEAVGLCGLLHDMGKIQVPLEVLNKDGALTDDEFAVMKKHTIFGRNILMSGRNVFSGTVDVAYGHHENLDGTGYPRSLLGHQMNLFTKMVAVVDKYDAITSNRVYQQGRTHLDAVNVLNQLAKGKIDPQLALAFIACLGIYPAGSVVELSSGEVAVVIEPNPQQRLRPRIVVVLDQKGNPLPRQRFVDLAECTQDTLGKPYSIKKMHRPERFGINLAEFRNLISQPIPGVG